MVPYTSRRRVARALALCLVAGVAGCDLESQDSPSGVDDAATGTSDAQPSGPKDAAPTGKDTGLGGAESKPDASNVEPKPDAMVTPGGSDAGVPPSGPPPATVEGVPNWAELPVIALSLPAVQPVKFDRDTVCAGESVTLLPAPGAEFPARRDDDRVLFSPCGLPAEIQEWTPAGITVRTPLEAETGPVWLAAGADGEADKRLGGGQNCLATLHAGVVIPERLRTLCDETGLDAFDARLRSALRGVPVPPADAEGGPPAQTTVPLLRPELGDPQAPRCVIESLPRRGPLSFAESPDAPGGPQALTITQGGGDRIGCFETCEQVGVGIAEGDGPTGNVLRVKTPPRIERLLPDVGTIDALGRHRVEHGKTTLRWRIRSEEPPQVSMTRDQGQAVAVPAEGDLSADAEGPAQFVFRAGNTCGETMRVLDLDPVTTLSILPDRLDLTDEAESEARVVISWPRPEPLEIALDDTSGGMLRLDRRTVTLAAGETEASFRVSRAPRAASMPAGASLGTIAPRLANPGDPAASTVIDAYEPIRVFGVGGGAGEPLPGPGQVLVRGRLRYRECAAEQETPVGRAADGQPFTLDADRCLLEGRAPFFRPVRRARVEIWDQAPLIDQQRAVVETNDSGEFFALVPADGEYDVTAVASSFAGQVDLENDALTWFWKPLRLPQRAAAGGTLVYDFDFGRGDARHFNALDGITRGLEYALDRSGVSLAGADAKFRKTVVIPGSGSAGITLRVGQATHIWLGAWNQIFSDETVLHEYGHHMQHANGTYQVWGTLHDGCYASAVGGPACFGARRRPGQVDDTFDAGCWVNSAQLSWFEGFPAYFSSAVMDFDDGRTLTRTDRYSWPFFPAPARFCPLAENPHWNHLNERINGAAVEDYVRGGLAMLVDRRDLDDGGGVLTREGIERHLFQIFVDEIDQGAPTFYDFRDRWNARFPASSALAEIMTLFRM